MLQSVWFVSLPFLDFDIFDIIFDASVAVSIRIRSLERFIFKL